MGFLKSKAFGDVGENYVKNILHKIGVDVDSYNGIEYDLKCKLKRKNFTVEIKYDWMAQKTGNLAIEYYNTKKCSPSGITATEADIWCVCLEDGNNICVWMVNTNILREFIEHTPPIREVVGGDNNAALKLYSQDDILPIFTRIDDKINEKDILKSIKELLKNA